MVCYRHAQHCNSPRNPSYELLRKSIVSPETPQEKHLKRFFDSETAKEAVFFFMEGTVCPPRLTTLLEQYAVTDDRNYLSFDGFKLAGESSASP